MSLREAAFSAGRWTTASLFLRALLQIAQTMILARLLAPADFGLMAIVGAVYAIATLFVDLGLTHALIHFPDPSPVARSTLYWLNLGAAGLVMSAFMALAWPLASLYGQPELLAPMLALGLVMPLSALGQQFCVLAEKDLRFSTLAVLELLAACCGFAAAVVVAFQGGGVYAFVAASLVSAAAASAFAWAFLSRGIRPTLCFSLNAVKPYLRYGSYRLGETVLNSVQSQSDVLIGGAVAGASAMGFYTLPRGLTLQAANSVVNPVVTRVSLPVMAKLQGDRAALGWVYLQTLRMTASVNFPVYAVLAVWADEVVAVLLGDQWHAAGDLLRIFALWGLVRSTANPVGSLLYATGRVRPAFWWNLAVFLMVPGLCWIGVTLGGTHGLALSLLCVQLLLFYPLFRLLVHPACGVQFAEYAGALVPALIASGLAVGVGVSVAALCPDNAWVRLPVGCAVVALAYLGASCVLNRPWVAAMTELLGPILRRNP